MKARRVVFSRQTRDEPTHRFFTDNLFHPEWYD